VPHGGVCTCVTATGGIVDFVDFRPIGIFPGESRLVLGCDNEHYRNQNGYQPSVGSYGTVTVIPNIGAPMKNIRRFVATAEVIPRLPDAFSPEYGNRIPPGIVGAQILSFGTLDLNVARDDRLGLESSGLVIDYVPRHDKRPRRVVLDFNDVSMWIEARLVQAVDGVPDSSRVCDPR
jgi:hypothetical protein